MDKATSEKVKVFTTDYVEFLEEHVGLQHVYTDLLGGKREEDWSPPREQRWRRRVHVRTRAK